jgi:dCTP deaminase
MLNCKELSDRMFVEEEGRAPISIIPRPNEGKFRSEAGASIDLSLGRWFRSMKQANIPLINLARPKGGEELTSEASFTKEYFIPFDGQFILHPGKFVLGITLEWMHIPGDLAGYVTGKSSLGRRGLIIETAAGVQPGFAGCLTLELANVGEVPVRLQPGMPVCQLFLHQTTSVNTNAKSQFKGSRKPSLGKIR